MTPTFHINEQNNFKVFFFYVYVQYVSCCDYTNESWFNEIGIYHYGAH